MEVYFSEDELYFMCEKKDYIERLGEQTCFRSEMRKNQIIRS